MDLNRLCFLLVGPSRSGKTALVKFFLRCLACERLDPITLNPCDRTCWTCKLRPETSDHGGLFVTLRAIDTGATGPEVHFLHIDCTKIRTAVDLDDRLNSFSETTALDGIIVAYLDEVHRLVNRSMDETLLKAIEEKPFLWILSTAKPGPLEDMLQKRLLKFITELPTSEELADWLADRCEEWGINYEPEAIIRVVEKSNRIVGTALHALALASLDPDEGLTVNLVENDWIVELGE